MVDLKTTGVVLGGLGLVAGIGYLGVRTKEGRAYLKHSALNLGQAARDARYFYEHPDADKMGRPGTARHVAASAVARIPSFTSNIYYAALPPQLHHSDEELYGEFGEDTKGPLKLRHAFMKGYDPWSKDG